MSDSFVTVKNIMSGHQSLNSLTVKVIYFSLLLLQKRLKRSYNEEVRSLVFVYEVKCCL